MKIVIKFFLSFIALSVIVAGIAYQQGWLGKIFPQVAYVEEAKFKRIVRDLVHGKEVQSLAKKRDVERLHSRVEQIGDLVNDQKKVTTDLEKSGKSVELLKDRVDTLAKQKEVDLLLSRVEKIGRVVNDQKKIAVNLEKSDADLQALKGRVDSLAKKQDIDRLQGKIEQIGDLVNNQKVAVMNLEKANTVAHELKNRIDVLEKKADLQKLNSQVGLLQGVVNNQAAVIGELDVHTSSTRRLRDRLDALERNADARISILEAEAKKKIDLERELAVKVPSHTGNRGNEENLVNDVEDKLNRVLKKIDLALTTTQEKIDKALNKHKKDVEEKFSSVKKDINRVKDQQEKVFYGARKIKKAYVKERVRRELADAVIKRHLSAD